MDIPFDEISQMSKYSFKLKVKEAVNIKAFDWLMKKIHEKNKSGSNTQAKGSEIEYEHLKLQNCLLPSKMNTEECKLLFSLRARMTPVKCNFRNSYEDLTCPICLDPDKQDSQLHLLHCATLLNGDNIIVKNNVCYEDIFLSDVTKQSTVVNLFRYLLSKRRKIEKQRTPEQALVNIY